ncbi:MAG: leucine--tRNA ligase [Opitutales bacterium]
MSNQRKQYAHVEIEARWQQYWEAHATFQAPDASDKPKYYILEMFPYPSGAGLHAGHAENFTGTDVLGRYKLATGHNVLHPMGWDAFGLPAEQYAVKTGTHPAKTTAVNIDNFRRQLKSLGYAIDWSREVNTTDPGYYRWTQWIFLQLFKHGLAYVDERPVNWCPALGTVLANEEVIDGKSEVGGHPVERRALRQWVLRITRYADKLLAGLDTVDWPESTKTQQTHWIGRSTGAEIDFAIAGTEHSLRVYTTRPDTLFGATYMVIAPEHPLVAAITTPTQKPAVEAYATAAAHKSDLDRTELAKDKSGVFTGAHAIHPVTGEQIPIWVADYVLMSYGTGAIMAVPAQDERDWEFAKKFDLPIVRTVQPPEGWDEDQAYTGDGPAIHSDFLDGLPVAEAKARMIAWLEDHQKGHAQVNFKLRDWLFSRQRYWGEPFPIVWVDESAYAQVRAAGGAVAEMLPPDPVTYTEDGVVHYALPIPPSRLPVKLPATDTYKPAGDGQSPLALLTDWTHVFFNVATGETMPRKDYLSNPSTDGRQTWVSATRETNTMPQWAGSCWYYLRYIDPHNDEALVDPAKRDYWGVPDFYMGGKEHAVLHLLYARFWHQFLVDIGVHHDPEPFKKLFHQGIVLGEDGEKMSKSRGNVANPDDYLVTHGADAFRVYLMFMGPLEDSKPWKTDGIEGPSRFLKKIWREFTGETEGLSPKIHDSGDETPATKKLLHQTIKKVTEDIEAIHYNTAISAMMVLVNHLGKAETIHRETAKTLVQLLAPFAPHLAEELWERLGEAPSVAHAPWPAFDPALLVESEAALGVLINGKPRGEVTVAKDAPQDAVLALAQADPKVAAHLEGKTLRKVIYVPGKILNLVVG